MVQFECTIRPATASDIPLVVQMAERIWHACYPGIISREQIDYMLSLRYNPEALKADIAAPGHWLELVFMDQRPVGFIQYTVTSPEEMKLDKLYLVPEMHGKGLGTHLLDHVAGRARDQGCSRLALEVNRANGRAIRAYERFGFAIRSSVETDIGHGFVVHDHVMEKRLTPP